MFIIIFISTFDLEKIRQRDPGAFEEIYRDHRKNIYNFLIIKTYGNRELAEDIFQETFHNAIKYASSLKDENKVLPWLIRIARTKLIDHIRKQKSKDNFDGMLDKKNAYNNEDTASIILEKEKKLLFKMALDAIDPKYSEILKLMYYENKSRKEIADLKKKSVASIESLLYRARKALKKELSRSLKGLQDE